MQRKKEKQEKKMSWKKRMSIWHVSKFCFLIGWISIGLIFGGSLVHGQTAVSLQEWIDLAFDTNPEYLLQYQDYQLALQGLHIKNQTGFEQIQLSLDPATLSEKGLSADPGINLNISGNLPYQIQMTGDQSLESDWSGNMAFEGNLDFSWNWQEFVKGQKEQDMQWLQLEQQFYQNRAGLAQQVVASYYQLILKQIRLESAKKEVQLKQHQFDQNQIQYQAGRISKYDLIQSEMTLQTAVDQYEEEIRTNAKAKREFAWVFGEHESKLEGGIDLELFIWTGEKHVSELIQMIEANELPFGQIAAIQQTWNPEELENYQEQTYEYRLALENLRQRKEALQDVQKENQWKLTAGVNVYLNHNVIDKDPFTYTGTVGLSKNLYQRQFKLQEEQAQLNLEREELALAQTKERFAYDLLSQMEEIVYLEQQCQKRSQELVDWEADLDRIKEQNRVGYLSREELLKGEQLSLEKLTAFIQSQLQLTQAKMKLGQVLCLPEFWQ